MRVELQPQADPEDSRVETRALLDPLVLDLEEDGQGLMIMLVVMHLMAHREPPLGIWGSRPVRLTETFSYYRLSEVRVLAEEVELGQVRVEAAVAGPY